MHNSYKLYVNLSQDGKKKVQIGDMFGQQGVSRDKILEVHLKMDQFNNDLLCYLRYVLKSDFFKINPKKISNTTVIDVKFEIHCIQHYVKLISCLGVHEHDTTLE